MHGGFEPNSSAEVRAARAVRRGIAADMALVHERPFLAHTQMGREILQVDK